MKGIKKQIAKILSRYNSYATARLIEKYLIKGMIAWTPGYDEYKTLEITKALNNDSLVKDFNNSIPKGFGLRLDERIVEYPWIFNKMPKKTENILDAGSTFNFDFIVNHAELQNKKLFIYTFNPEANCFHSKGISYIYGDLRDIIIKDNQFDLVVSQSTIEHIGMNNSIYGHNEVIVEQKNYEYIQVIKEFLRILKSEGQLLLTFPYGQYENHSFFQQFDKEMVTRIKEILKPQGVISDPTFIKYTRVGWEISNQEDSDICQSYNPHTGVGKSDDGAAHCRAICCIEFVKK